MSRFIELKADLMEAARFFNWRNIAAAAGEYLGMAVAFSSIISVLALIVVVIGVVEGAI